MAQTYNKASERVFGGQTLCDVLGTSPQNRRRMVLLPIPSVVANSTTATGLAIPAASTSGFKIISADFIWFGTVPACSGGTATIQIDRLASDGTTATVVLTAASILTGVTANVGFAANLAVTNPTAITGGQSVKISVVTSNNTVQTSGSGYGFCTLWVEPIEDTTISF